MKGTFMNNIVENKIILYHGSEKIINKPEFGKGEVNNDYGQGFYCTGSKNLAGEWAVLWTERDGYINEYSFGCANLKFDIIEFTACHPASASIFLQPAKNRDEEARRRYLEMDNPMQGTLLPDLIGRDNL